MASRSVLSVAVAAMALVGAAPAAAQTAKPAVQAQNAAPAAAPKPAPAPVSNDPETQTASYGDWVLRCQRLKDASGPAPKRACEIVQSLTVQGQNAPIAQIAFGRMNPSDPLRMTVVAPHDISFPSAVRVAVDEKDAQPAELAWTRCLPVGCFATGTPSADHLKRWRGAEAGRLVVKSGGGQDVAIAFSYRGLAQAMDALAKEK